MPDRDHSDKSLPALASDLWQLVVDFLKQETLDPLKSLGRFLGFGVAGAVITAAGLVLLLVGGLRALQTKTGSTFTGNWSWAPYLIVAVAALVLAALAMAVRSRKPSRGPERGTR